jgi:hypothetical protein
MMMGLKLSRIHERKKKICYKKTSSFEEGIATTTTSHNCCSSVLLCFFVCNFFLKQKTKKPLPNCVELQQTKTTRQMWGSLRACPEILRNRFPDPEATDSVIIGVMMSGEREKLHFQNHCGRCPS